MLVSQNDGDEETMLFVSLVAATLCKELISFPISLADSASVEVLCSEPLVIESLRGSNSGRIIEELAASFIFPRRLSLIIHKCRTRNTYNSFTNYIYSHFIVALINIVHIHRIIIYYIIFYSDFVRNWIKSARH